MVTLRLSHLIVSNRPFLEIDLPLFDVTDTVTFNLAFTPAPVLSGKQAHMTASAASTTTAYVTWSGRTVH